MRYRNMRIKKYGWKTFASVLGNMKNKLGMIIDNEEMLWHHARRDKHVPLKRRKIK